MPVGVDSTSSSQITNHAAFIWSVADLLRGDYKQSEYGRVILPFTVLRRLDCVLDPVKAGMLAKYESVKGRVENFGPVLDALTDIDGLWNTSRFDLPKLLNDPDNLADNLRAYIHGFSPQAQEILDKFDFPTQISRLDKAKLLYLVVSRFAEIDLHPDQVSNLEMGYLYEELIRRFSELSNETAGEHFTPREVIRLMVELLFAEDDDLLRKPGIVKTLFDPACGTGGMLSVAEDRLRELNPDARLEVFGQELNDETYAICRSDMMLKGQDASNIASGNSFSDDGHPGRRFDYLLANPPFGVEWKKVRDVVEDEHKSLGFAGRFGAGTPRINDGSFLFLQHMISKMKTPEQGGSRLAIVFNGSPLFTGAAGSGESEIRRWIIENDWLEAIIALPENMFYNTGIATYIWVLANRKSEERKGKVQLIDATEWFVPLRRNLGKKNCEFSEEHIRAISDLVVNPVETEKSKIFLNEAFGYWKVTVDRPLRLAVDLSTVRLERFEKICAKGKEKPLANLARRVAETLGAGPHLDFNAFMNTCDADADKHGVKLIAKRKKLLQSELCDTSEEAAPVLKKVHKPGKAMPDPIHGLFEAEVNGKTCVVEYEPDTALRDSEQVPLLEEGGIEAFFRREVLPYTPDAWIDPGKTLVGYEISFTRHFYRPAPMRTLDEIKTDIYDLEQETEGLLEQIVGEAE